KKARPAHARVEPPATILQTHRRLRHEPVTPARSIGSFHSGTSKTHRKTTGRNDDAAARLTIANKWPVSKQSSYVATTHDSGRIVQRLSIGAANIFMESFVKRSQRQPDTRFDPAHVLQRPFDWYGVGFEKHS